MNFALQILFYWACFRCLDWTWHQLKIVYPKFIVFIQTIFVKIKTKLTIFAQTIFDINERDLKFIGLVFLVCNISPVALIPLFITAILNLILAKLCGYDYWRAFVSIHLLVTLIISIIAWKLEKDAIKERKENVRIRREKKNKRDAGIILSCEVQG